MDGNKEADILIDYIQDFLEHGLEDFYNSTLKPFVDYDDESSTELVEILDIFFKNNENLTRIS